MKTPCYGCKERHATCHCSCELYKAYRAEKERDYERRVISSTVTDALYRPMHERVDAWRRRKGRRG
jgi:hypothetical protein